MAMRSDPAAGPIDPKHVMYLSTADIDAIAVMQECVAENAATSAKDVSPAIQERELTADTVIMVTDNMIGTVVESSYDVTGYEPTEI